MTAYYNENDPFAAQWLRNLIAAKLIAAGEVDERSIKDVKAADLKGFTQAHFFAGIGGWSLALRLAGWPDKKPVWTGSCPCQPFSNAGSLKGQADERHLWPVWFKLIRKCSPSVVFGEQVEAAIRQGWLDAVFADLEGQDYACGAAVLPACGIGAPHIRQRLLFVGHSNGGHAIEHALLRQEPKDSIEAGGARASRLVANANGRHSSPEGLQRGGEYGQRAEDGGAGELGDADGEREISQPGVCGGAQSQSDGVGASFWSPCDWLPCTDGKARPVEPGTFPLAHGIPSRVGRLRGYGNAIVAEVAAEFIKATR